MAQTTLDQRMLGVGTSLTDHTITASDVITFADVGDSNLTKRDTVQGVLDLASGTYDLHSQGSYSGATQSEVAFTNLTHDIYFLHLWNVQISASEPLMIAISYDNGSNYSNAGGAATALTNDWYSTNHCTRNNGDIATEGRHGTSSGETEITGYSSTYKPAAGAPQANLFGMMTIDRKKDEELYVGGMHDWSYHNAGYAPVRCNGAWFHNASGGSQGDMDAFKIYPNSGHFTDIHFKLYGTNVT
jgi:hypothetical protein|tara:strand:+ start:281 stop:1012 length:732 start_codon:yes stop_codon:yes gene_type:complete